MERMVMVTNMMDSRVGISDPSTGLRRRWEKRGQTLPIPFDALQNVLWQDGVRRMFTDGILYIKNMEDKKALGLEPQEAEGPTNIIALDDVQMRELLTVKPIAVFKKEISQLPDVQIDNLIDFAISNKIINAEKCSILKQVTGRDIIAAVGRQQQIEEEEKAEKNRAAEGRRI